MTNEQVLKEWAKCHVFYDMYEHPLVPNKKCKTYEEEVKWRKKFLEAPNGYILKNNEMFKVLKSKEPTYLLHVTTKLKSMLQSRTIFSSAGCLVGSIYCTPLYPQENNKFGISNLGRYISFREAEKAVKLRGDEAPIDLLIIEVQKSNENTNNLIGIDYLKLGKIHLNSYNSLRYLLSNEETTSLEHTIVTNIRRSIGFLTKANISFFENTNTNSEEFLNSLSEMTKNIPVLGYLYFEALSEYLTLFVDTSQNQKKSKFEELDNWGYKDFTFLTYSKLLKNFNLGQFSPSVTLLQDQLEKLHQLGTLPKLDIKEIINFLHQRILFLINARLFDPRNEPLHWHNLNWEFSMLAEQGLKPLIGHMLHRELRHFDRHREFYFYFDQNKALQAWNYWNHMSIETPFTGILPKGEIGINPANPNLKYKIYKGKPNLKDHTIEIEKELDIKISPRLVDLKHTFMRSQSENGIIKG